MVEALMDIAVNSSGKPSEVYCDVVWTHRGRQIGPRTVNQKLYVDAIRANTITFGIGPAGTGKTYLATAMAVSAFFSKQVGRIILTRPTVEAGESLGFLPGTVSEKVDPYFRPLFDALYDLSLIHISEPTRLGMISYAVFCLKKKKTHKKTK